MNRTENYQLPQWVKEDRIMMKDFNDAMGTIDAGMAEAKGEVDKRYAIGSYTGDGKTKAQGGQHIEVGFQPRFLIISRGWSTVPPTIGFFIRGEQGSTDADNYVLFEENGFWVSEGSANGVRINTNNYVYSYLAVR